MYRSRGGKLVSKIDIGWNPKQWEMREHKRDHPTLRMQHLYNFLISEFSHWFAFRTCLFTKYDKNHRYEFVETVIITDWRVWRRRDLSLLQALISHPKPPNGKKTKGPRPEASLLQYRKISFSSEFHEHSLEVHIRRTKLNLLLPKLAHCSR